MAASENKRAAADPGVVRRRTLLRGAVGVLAAAALQTQEPETSKLPPRPSAGHLPRWRGFNLTEKTTAEHAAPYRESDFEWIAEWGFDFVRLPMSYRGWSEKEDWLKLREPVLKEIDDAVELGQKHGIHVNLNLHRAPGYCVNPPKEPLDLWSDPKALDACAFHWGHLARRFKGTSSARLSFDLLNEPANVSEDAYVRVVKRLCEAIRAEDPARIIITDGIRWGRDPVAGLASLGVAQSTRGYDPMELSHWKANWVGGSEKWASPTWPLRPGGKDSWDQNRLQSERIEPWKALEQKGVGVHVGEWGAFRFTPHGTVLAWMRDQLDLWKKAGWGWALWNFRGPFGLLDSDREDVKYEPFRGHKLDRKMLELLRTG